MRYQALILVAVCATNYLNSFMEKYLVGLQICFSSSEEDTLPSIRKQCLHEEISVVVASGIGFVFFGNIYDNFEQSRTISIGVFTILAIFTLLMAVLAFLAQSAPDSYQPSILTLF